MEKMPVFCDREEACAVTERIRMSGTYTDGLVSVIIPVYNAEKYLLKTVESVLQQTYREFEIILVNDCSKDGSLKLMEELSKEHPQVKSHTLEHNSGAAVARNYGLKAAQGRYIAFLDSDDTWSPDKLAKQVAMAGEKGAAFVYCAYDMVDAEGMPLGAPVPNKPVTTYKDLLTKTMIATSAVLIDRYKTGDFTMPLRRTGQDYALWMQLLREHDAYGMDEAMAHICRRNDSLSKNKLQNIRDVWEVQTAQEGIGILPAAFHVVGYVFYALGKRMRRK